MSTLLIGVFKSLHDVSGDTRNFKDGTVLHESIDAGLARAPEELAVLVALAVQSRSLTVAVFYGGSSDEGVPEKCHVLLATLLAKQL